MTMQLTEQTVGIWCVQVGEHSDWLCYLAHQDGKFVVDYTFRIQDSCHERCSYHGELKSALDMEDAVERVRKLYQTVLDHTRDKHGWELLREPIERHS